MKVSSKTKQGDQSLVGIDWSSKWQSLNAELDDVQLAVKPQVDLAFK